MTVPRIASILMCACALGLISLIGSRSGADVRPALQSLPNGLRILVQEKHTSPLVAIDLWVDAGARSERTNEDGCAHFLEHTLFKGTTSRAPGQIDMDIENLGGTLNAATGPDYAHFYTVVTTDGFLPALKILADVVRNATLPASEVDRERGVILDELAQHNADPYARIIDTLYAEAFHDHPYRRSPGGTPTGIRSRTRDELMEFYRRTYIPERCTLAVAGDVTLSSAAEAARSAFGDWRIAPTTGAPQSLESTANGYRELEALRGHTTTHRSTDRRDHVGIALPAPAAGDRIMACAALVAAAILGNEEEPGRLASTPLHGADGEARYTPRRHASLFTVLATKPVTSQPAANPSIDNDTLQDDLLNAIHSLTTSPPSQPELDRARQRVLGHWQVETETNAGVAKTIGYADIVYGEMPAEFEARLNRLTTADITAFARSFLDTKRAVCVQLKAADASAGGLR